MPPSWFDNQPIGPGKNKNSLKILYNKEIMSKPKRQLRQKLQVNDDSWRVLMALLVSTLASLLLYLGRVRSFDSLAYWFMLWNLLLAWVPLVLAWVWYRRVRVASLNSPLSWVLLVLWLGFLPNSFYIITDFIHLVDAGKSTVLYDVAMLMSFAWNGILLGFLSIAVVHTQFLKHFPRRYVHLAVGIVCLLCSFAIYLGRYLRWNTWDVLVNPAGILFSVSDQFVYGSTTVALASTVATFFVLLTSMYMVLWQLAGVIRDKE